LYQCSIFKYCSSLRPKNDPYPKPYNVLWIYNNSIAVNEICLFPIKFLDYYDEIWFDTISMDVGHAILGRPCIYDLDITISGGSNSCSFTFKCKKIKLIGLPPKPSNKNKKKENVKDQRLTIMSPNEFEKKVKDQPILSGLAKNKISRNS